MPEPCGPSRAPLKDEKGRTVFEATLVVILVSILLFIAADRYVTSVKLVKETALRIELSNIRNGITFYAALNRKLPSSLKDLVKENAKIAEKDKETGEDKFIFLGKYVDALTTDSEGNPADPFGGRYVYDANTGRVRTSTRGYERW